MKFRGINWRRLGWFFLSITILTLGCLSCVSNHYVYFSHQRSPFLAKLQREHQASAEFARSAPIIVAHRGWGLESTAPDASSGTKLIGNTRAAIRKAIAVDVEWIEVDVRETLDRELVLFHDSSVDAKTNQKGKVNAMTSQELKSCDLLVDPPEQILSLKELFSEFHDSERRWVIDVKVPGIADKVIAQIEGANIPKEQVIIFGDHDVLKDYSNKGYRLGYTTLFRNHLSMIYSTSGVLRRCHENSYDLLVVPVVLVTPKLVARAGEIGIEVWSYGTNDSRDLEYCAKSGVKGLIVDEPEAAMAHFRDSIE